MMFIHSAKKFLVKRKDGSAFIIRKDFVGEIPDDVAQSKLVQLAIQDGSISTPASKKDKDVDETVEETKKTVKAAQKKKEA